MTTRTETGTYGILASLSPEMARDLGDAFSLERIGARPPRHGQDYAPGASRSALRVATRVAAFLLVAVVTVSVTAGALLLMRL